MLITKQRFVLESTASLDTQEIRQLEAVREDAGLLWKHLQEPDVTDVVVNADGKVWVKRAGTGFSDAGLFSPHDPASPVHCRGTWQPPLVPRYKTWRNACERPLLYRLHTKRQSEVTRPPATASHRTCVGSDAGGDAR